MLRLILSLVCLATPISAEVAGQSDPRFETALEHWLNGEERPAFEHFRDLAVEGNLAAQVMLGQISDFRYSQTLLDSLSRREFRQLSRAQNDGSAFGQSWTDIAAAHTPLAAAFQDANSADTYLDALPVLAEYGENGTLIRLLTSRAYNQNEIAQRVSRDDLPAPSQLFYDAYIGSRDLFEAIARATSLEDFEAALDAHPSPSEGQSWIATGPDMIAIFSSADHLNTAVARYSTHAAVAPVRQVCATLCGPVPEDVGLCTVAAFAITENEAYEAMFGPTETLLPAERYQKSPRFQSDMVALICNAPYWHEDVLEQLSPCLHQVVCVD